MYTNTCNLRTLTPKYVVKNQKILYVICSVKYVCLYTIALIMINDLYELFVNMPFGPFLGISKPSQFLAETVQHIHNSLIRTMY